MRPVWRDVADDMLSHLIQSFREAIICLQTRNAVYQQYLCAMTESGHCLKKNRCIKDTGPQQKCLICDFLCLQENIWEYAEVYMYTYKKHMRPTPQRFSEQF